MKCLVYKAESYDVLLGSEVKLIQSEMKTGEYRDLLDV